MVSNDTFRQIALSFAGSTEAPHFEKASFRVVKKIFATLDEKNRMACVKLSVIDQHVFAAFDKTVIYPVPNKWGLQGWTMISLAHIRKAMCVDAVSQAWLNTTAGKKTAPSNTNAKNK
jgi:hypothetical protein